MERILILYYSRTGNTKKVAEFLQKFLYCYIEEIVSIKDRSGVKGYVLCAKEATSKTPAKIKPISNNISAFDLVVIGTPIWAWSLSSPVRAALEQNKDKFKRISAFCTMGNAGAEKVFSQIEEICGKKLEAKMAVLAKDVEPGNFKDAVKGFITRQF